MSRIQKFLLIFTIVFIASAISILAGYFFSQKVTKKPLSTPVTTATHLPTTPTPTPLLSLDEALTDKGKFPSGEKVAQVGEEIIYGRDMNYILYEEFPQDFFSPAASISALKQKGILTAINDSVLLQSEAREGLISLTPMIFNNPNKNLLLRKKRVQEITKRRIATEEKISGAAISIWYHNVKPPSIPIDEAEKLAKTKIEKVYNDVKQGKITFQEGGNRIMNDTALAKIDFSYKGNAYMEFTEKAIDDRPFAHSKLNEVLLSLKEEEMSEIIKVVSPPDSQNPDEEFYAFVKIFKRTNRGSGNFFSWLEKEKKSYEIVVY